MRADLHRAPGHGQRRLWPHLPDCGTREALESIGVDTAEQDKIIETIHRCQRS